MSRVPNSLSLLFSEESYPTETKGKIQSIYNKIIHVKKCNINNTNIIKIIYMINIINIITKIYKLYNTSNI